MHLILTFWTLVFLLASLEPSATVIIRLIVTLLWCSLHAIFSANCLVPQYVRNTVFVSWEFVTFSRIVIYSFVFTDTNFPPFFISVNTKFSLMYYKTYFIHININQGNLTEIHTYRGPYSWQCLFPTISLVCSPVMLGLGAGLGAPFVVVLSSRETRVFS